MFNLIVSSPLCGELGGCFRVRSDWVLEVRKNKKKKTRVRFSGSGLGKDSGEKLKCD